MSKQEATNIVAVGDVLAGKYRVEKVLGMGGMGVVVAATHLDLREIRAVKLMRPDAESEQSVERFLREARAVVRLRSEHVAEVYDVGRLENGAPYIVMEMLLGQDLSALQKRRGPFPIEEAVLYVSQACHALAEAHAAGIVHRDLKPGNLFLTRRADGSACIKVLDFGISKHTNPEGSIDPEMTGARDLMGSPLYMAPEQMRSARKVDARADVWSLGAILYKLLVGRAPFQAPTVPEIFANALGKPARLPSTIRPEIPRGLDAVILRCLDKIPARRFSTATDLLAALRPFGPWNSADDEDGDMTVLNPHSRRSTMPPVRLKIGTPSTPPSAQDKPVTMVGAPAGLIPANRRSSRPTPPPLPPPRQAIPTAPTVPSRLVEPSPEIEVELSPDDTPGASVSPWEGSRPAQKPARLLFIATLSAAFALAGAGVAALAVYWPALPQAVFRETIKTAAGASPTTPERARGAADATGPGIRPEGATPQVSVDPDRPTSQSLEGERDKEKNQEDAMQAGVTASTESERVIDLGEDPPSTPDSKTVVPVRTEKEKASDARAKPHKEGPQRYDPFRGRH